jgi:hypothetical protein
MYTGAEDNMLVPTASNLTLAAAINREYERMTKYAADHEGCWARSVFHRTAFWSCQPTLVLLAS